jgi:hypothetical protein
MIPDLPRRSSGAKGSGDGRLAAISQYEAAALGFIGAVGAVAAT